MKNKIIFKSLIVLMFSIFIMSCRNNSSTFKVNNQVEHKNPEKAKAINGVYSYKDSQVKLIITISGNYWNGKTTIYDVDTTYDNGIVKGHNLYESSGTARVGYIIDGNSLSILVGSRSVTLRK